LEKVFKTLRSIFLSAPGRGAVSSLLLFSSFFAMFSSLPTISAYISESRAKGLFAALFGAVFSFAFGGIWGVVLYSVVVVLGSVIIGELIKSGKDFKTVITISSISIMGVYLLSFLVYAFINSSGLMELLISMVNTAFDLITKNYPQFIEQQLMNTGMSRSELIRETAIQIPSVVGVTIMVFVLVNVIMLARSKGNISKFLRIENLKKVKLPEKIVWLAIAVGAFYLYSVSEYNTSMGMKAIGLFLFRTLAVVYFLQGIIIVHQFSISMLGGGLISIMLFSLLVVFAYMFVVAVGFFDLWFNFRKYIKKEGDRT